MYKCTYITRIDVDVNFLYRLLLFLCAPPDPSEKINDDLLGKRNFLLDWSVESAKG